MLSISSVLSVEWQRSGSSVFPTSQIQFYVVFSIQSDLWPQFYRPSARYHQHRSHRVITYRIEQPDMPPFCLTADCAADKSGRHDWSWGKSNLPLPRPPSCKLKRSLVYHDRGALEFFDTLSDCYFKWGDFTEADFHYEVIYVILPWNFEKLVEHVLLSTLFVKNSSCCNKANICCPIHMSSCLMIL